MIKSYKFKSEPGIILVSFETELQKILALRRYAELQNEYRICFMPTWQNFFCPEVVELDARATNPYYLLPSSLAESNLQPLLGPQARILPFHAASWVNHNLSCSKPTAKDVDIIMLANFSRLKRHWKLFEAIASLPSNLRIVLIGVPLITATNKVCFTRPACLASPTKLRFSKMPARKSSRIISNEPDSCALCRTAKVHMWELPRPDVEYAGCDVCECHDRHEGLYQ